MKQGHFGGVTGNFQTGVNNSALGPIAGFTVRLMYQPLTWFNPYKGNALDGLLAESWEFNAAVDKLTVRLRTEARWSDGRPLTSADVKFTLDKYLTPPEKFIVAGSAQTLVRSLGGVTAVDPRTVVLDLKAPDVSVAALLSDNDVSMMPAHRTLEQSAKTPIGSGAYVLAETQPDIKYVFTKNTNYWAMDGANKLPYLDGIENIEISDQSRALPLVLTGQIDILNVNWLQALLGKDAEVKRRIPNATLHGYPGGNIGWGLKNAAPYDNQSVRRAFSILTDRLAIVELAHNANGFIDGLGVRPSSNGNTWGLPMKEVLAIPGFRYVNKKTGELETDMDKLREGLSAVYQKDPKDIEMAKKMLADAGLYDARAGRFPSFTIMTWAGVAYEPTAVVIAQTLKDHLGGGKFTLEAVEQTIFAQRGRQGQFEATVNALHPSAADEPSLTLRFLVTGAGLWNHGFQVPVLDDLFARQRREVDPAKRRELVHDFQRKLIESAHAIPGANSRNPTGLWREWVKNVPRAIGGSSNVFGLDRVWLETRS